MGKAIAEELLKKQVNHVVGIGRSCTITHERYHHNFLDLSQTEDVSKFEFKLFRGTRHAVLINNAGVIGPVAPVGRMDIQGLVAGFTVNLVSPAILMNNFIRHTQNNRSDRMIINISSGAARRTIESWAMYCATKSGLDMFSEVLHREQPIYHAKRPVRIFCISPGVVDTDMQTQIRTLSKKDFSMKDLFITMKKNSILSPADKTAKTILKIVERPEQYSKTCLNIRDFE